MTNKLEAMEAWLEANPGKNRQDWLLEVRCKDEKQRKEVAEILRICKEANLVYEIPYVYVYSDEPEVWFDFAVHRFPIDLDAPDELFENINPKRPWEAAARYLDWKAEHDFGEGFKFDYEGLPHEDYFHDSFMDWRDHAFLEGFCPGKKLNWSK